MQTLRPKYASLAKFRATYPKILFGDVLKDVKRLERSIRHHGLLSPLVVSKNRNRYLVIEGAKRLAALRRLKFNGKLPRDLKRIPYVLIDQSRGAHADLSLLSNREKYEKVQSLRRGGLSLREISTAIFTPKKTVSDILNVSKLSARLKQAYFGDAITLDQVAAFSTIPNPAAQDALLLKLGPFAQETEILSHITAGDTVLALGEDNIIILPSRKAQKKRETIAA